jgi:hypothetical protein
MGTVWEHREYLTPSNSSESRRWRGMTVTSSISQRKPTSLGVRPGGRGRAITREAEEIEVVAFPYQAYYVQWEVCRSEVRKTRLGRRGAWRGGESAANDRDCSLAFTPYGHVHLSTYHFYINITREESRFHRSKAKTTTWPRRSRPYWLLFQYGSRQSIVPSQILTSYVQQVNAW